MNRNWWLGFGVGLALGLVVAAGATWYATREVDKLRTLAVSQTEQIVSQQQEVDHLKSANSLCNQKLQASAQRQIQMQLALQEYQSEQGQVPAQLLTLLAKFLF